MKFYMLPTLREMGAVDLREQSDQLAFFRKPEPATARQSLIDEQALRGLGLALPGVALGLHLIELIAHERQLRTSEGGD